MGKTLIFVFDMHSKYKVVFHFFLLFRLESNTISHILMATGDKKGKTPIFDSVRALSAAHEQLNFISRLGIIAGRMV